MAQTPTGAARPAAATQPEAFSGSETSPVAPPVERTSLAARGSPPDEVTLRFTRWTAHGLTAYQAGEYAGFPPRIARQLIADGRAVVAQTAAQRNASVADRVMVTK